jgi:hypothetical protein
MIRKYFVVVLLTSLIGNLLVPTLACGPFIPAAVYSFQNNPDLPLKSYAAGNLGVVLPSFAKSYLVVAYRYLNGKPLSKEEQTAAEALWKDRVRYGGADDNSAPGVDSWTSVRKKVAGVKAVTIDPLRKIAIGDDPYDGDWYTNCNPDSFKNAARVLDEKITKHGADSAFVKDWVTAQDLVFCHCSGGKYDWNKKKADPEPPFPGEAGPQANPEEKYDRQYQMAAAKFYAQNFDQSLTEFKQIAAETASPYASLANYMVARCLLRKATLTLADKSQINSTLQSAETQLKSLIANPALSSIHAECRQLINFVNFRLRTQEYLTELAALITTDTNPSDFQQNLDDYTLLLDKLQGVSDDGGPPKQPLPEAARKDDLSDWITIFQANNKSQFGHALEKWHQTHSEAWLIAALHLAPADKAKCSELLAASQALVSTSPGFLSANYEACRWKIANQEGQSIPKLLTNLENAAQTKHLPSSVNLFMDLRELLPMTLEQFVENAVRKPSALAWDLEYFEDAFAPSAGKNSGSAPNKKQEIPFAFDDRSAKLMNLQMPLSSLVQVCANGKLPANLRANVTQAAWVRSVILGDNSARKQLSPLLAAAIPSMAPLLKQTDSGTPAQQNFSAAFLILNNPGMRPYVTPGAMRDESWNKLDTYNDNWWGDKPYATQFDADDASTSAAPVKRNDFPGLLTNAQLAGGADEQKRMLKSGTGPTYLGTQVVSYATTNKTDPRIPEALSLVVRCSHYGFRDAHSTAVSKQAFQILHRDYPKDPFTIKTKFYY